MKTKLGYKLYEQNTNGDLLPLFCGKTIPVPVGEWFNAEVHVTKNFSNRPGIHVGEVCDAPWLKSADGTYKSQRSKYWKRVWCLVEYNITNDYTEYVQSLPGKRMQDKVPENGYYKWKEAGCNRIWHITDRAKIIKVLSEEERQRILKQMDYDEEQAFAPYKVIFEKRQRNVG